jgi:RNA polymerase sigma-70 factor (ECF subfamily)
MGVLTGDSGFDAIVAEHHADIYRYLLRMTGRTPVADDLSEETFVRAYRSLSDDGNARSRLFGIATDLGRKHLRRKGRRGLDYGRLTAGAVDPVRTGGGMTAAIEAVVAILPFEQRAAFLQRKVHGLEYAAIGQSLRCSIERAQSLVFRALQRIRQALDWQGEGFPEDRYDPAREGRRLA